MIAVFESHNVARTGVDLNHFVHKILNINGMYVGKSFFVNLSVAIETALLPSEDEERCKELH